MYKSLLIAASLIIAAPVAQAANLLDWLEQAAPPKSLNSHKAEKEAADSAHLITLEDRESEMYPRPSGNNRFILTLTEQGKQMWISRRISENGDPLNRVTTDSHAFDSIAWKPDGKVSFLSERAGGLGLWEKISDGEGMLRRIMPLHGMLTQAILLPDESMIAVRLVPLNRGQQKSSNSSHATRDSFNNWEFPGMRGEIVRIHKNGSEQILVNEGVNPALSPDGQWIVFAMPAGRSMHLFRMHTDGSDLIQVTDARSIDVQPSWSADGKQILFTSNRADADMRHPSKSDWDVWAIGADGRGLTQITFDKARDGAPHMDSHGHIYFHSDRDISKQEFEARQVKSGRTHTFHVWSINMPAHSSTEQATTQQAAIH